jgi:phospholipid transport system transporter-binding protein
MPAAADARRAADGVVQLSGELGLDTVAALAERAPELFSGCSSARVDLAGVARADSAGLSLLLAWQRAALRDGCSLSFHHVPAALLAIADTCGVDAVLALAAD